mgnify:CR=1 FL=1
MSEYQLMTEDQRDMVKLVKDFLMKAYLSTRLRESIHWSFIRNWENLDFLQWMYRKSTAAWA